MWPRQTFRFDRWFELPDELSLTCEECGHKGLRFRTSDIVDNEGTIVAKYDCQGLVLVNGEEFYCGHVQRVEV